MNYSDLKDLCENISVCISKLQYANAEEERTHKDNLQIMLIELKEVLK